MLRLVCVFEVRKPRKTCFVFVCLLDLILYVPVMFQLCQDGSSWVTPVVSKDKCLLCVMFYYVFVTFPCGILGRVWCLIVSIPGRCLLSYIFTQGHNTLTDWHKAVHLSTPTTMFCLFDLILYVPSIIFQLNRDGSSWVEPVLR